MEEDACNDGVSVFAVDDQFYCLIFARKEYTMSGKIEHDYRDPWHY